MNILDQIILDKRREVELKKKVLPVSQLEKSELFGQEKISLSQNLIKSETGLILEHKRRSPSKSTIQNGKTVEEVVKGYQTSGACAVSVLTDAKYFGGSVDDLLLARAVLDIPILRKDFTIDEYQIIEAKSIGANAILLIASVLDKKEIDKFSLLAKSLGMEVLLEVHNLQELQNSMTEHVDMIGVNNRNLKTFEVSIQISKELSKEIPNDFVKISESGISNPETVDELKKFGYKGFLIGENFMKTDNPGLSAREFLSKITI